MEDEEGVRSRLGRVRGRTGTSSREDGGVGDAEVESDHNRLLRVPSRSGVISRTETVSGRHP